jgi:hypothetical protein
MAKFEMVCRPKDQGGLGIINTKIMNDCLLVKWIWKIHLEPNSLWFKILKAKYMKSGGFFGSSMKGSSLFWQGLHKIKHLFKWGAIFKVENGKLCRFWQDCWIMEVPLKIAYEDLFKFARDPDCVVTDCWDGDDWFIEFRRSLSAWEYDRWLELKLQLSDVTLSSNRDNVVWALDKTKMFTTKSLYCFLTDRGTASRVAGHIWKCKLPLKIMFFLWQAFNNKLQVGQSLIKRGWKGSCNCSVCGFSESVNHILFKCHLAKFIWSVIREVWHLRDVPRSLMEFSSDWLQGKGRAFACLFTHVYFCRICLGSLDDQE